ncbi:MAG TPA: DUF481 domain-containing protein [Burkholderiales bacterium]|nr:DUF481 domain-containing protein [Burkholderiales bacterium]
MRFLLLGALLCLVAYSAVGDEVRLANGDRISGTIKGKSGGKLIVATAHAGEVAVDWGKVVSITTTRPMEVLLRGASGPARGTLQPLYGGSALFVAADGSASEITLGDIAYLNPEPHESGAGTTYSGRATLSANYTGGNVESEHLYADAELTARALHHRYSISGKVEQREDPSLGNNSAWLAAANYDRFFDARQFGYARGSVERDEAKDLEQRSALGVGYGVDLFDSPAAALSVRGGPEYVVVERFAGPHEEYPAAGWGIKGRWRPAGGRLELFHEQDGFWNLEDTDVVTLRSKTGVRVPVIARLNATAQINIDWESEPAPGRASTDHTLLLGLDYTW